MAAFAHAYRKHREEKREAEKVEETGEKEVKNLQKIISDSTTNRNWQLPPIILIDYIVFLSLSLFFFLSFFYFRARLSP